MEPVEPLQRCNIVITTIMIMIMIIIEMIFIIIISEWSLQGRCIYGVNIVIIVAWSNFIQCSAIMLMSHICVKQMALKHFYPAHHHQLFMWCV